jgi:multidrug efflux pump subunit AcrA (membrane-fusion protein)
MKWRAFAAVVMLSLLVVACGPSTGEEPTPTPIPTSVVPDKPTYEVQRGTVEQLEEFTARVSPLKEEALYFKKGGYVEVAYADRGEWVEEGTVLAELEIEDLENQLALAQVDLDSAQKQYEAAEEALERQLFSAQMSLQAAELRLERSKDSPPIVNLTSQRLAVQRAEENVQKAEIAYKEALDRPWEPQRVRDSLLENITNAERALEEARARYNEAAANAAQRQASYESDIALLELDVEKAKQEIAWLERGVDASLVQRVESAQLRMERLQAQIKEVQLVAPFDGELTSFTVIPGRAVEARKNVAVIADPREVEITADLSGDQMSIMEEGMACEVTWNRRPGEVFTGIIAEMPYPYGTGGGSVRVENPDERTHILLDTDIQETGLEAGDLVKVTVLIERSEDTLWLPAAAIRTFEGRRFVMVRVGDRLQKVDIKLGVEGQDRIEVLEGLEEGQIIEGL